MSVAQIQLTTAWMSLGLGPLGPQVFSGTLVLQAADRRPNADDSSGTILGAIVGAAPSSLAVGREWWAKALLTDTVVSVIAGATSGSDTLTAGVTTNAEAAAGITGADVTALQLVSLTADGSLRPASLSDPAQFGRIAGFALAAAAAAAGTSVALTRHDSLTDSGWAFTPGPVFVGENGGVTQVEPTVGFVQVAGLAVSATTIVVDFGPPTLL